MLRLENVSVAYGAVVALRSCSIEVPSGGIVTLLGANGAGKTTALHAITGFARARAGTITWEGRSIAGLAPDRVVRAGISLVPEHRQLFPDMTVEENLVMGCFVHGLNARARIAIEQAFTLFPELADKRQAHAAMLSGGQQQMLAIGRALMALPRLLLLDEPSLGLAPLMVDRILAAIRTINQGGVTVLLVEQNAYRTLPMSTFSYVLENGRVVLSGRGRDLMIDPKVKASYLGML